MIGKPEVDTLEDYVDEFGSKWAAVEIIQSITEETNLSAISEENASVAEQTATSGESLNSVVETMTKEAVVLKELAQQLENKLIHFIES